MTSSAGAIDRLGRPDTRPGARDATDRRRVLVELVREGPYQELEGVLAEIDRAYAELAAGYSEEELAIVHDFAVRANDLIHEQTLRLRAE
ncbi:hypothetical protein E1292_22695 [Nonomuraea deserti]|uniref:Uncharacterized protein n=1 Tax=Nonomuraea deserti TaxID=1848322 RepID=A0A4V2YA85_9ACTN|nr:hypothetical protein [Nonomuraea deserti]TDD02756.1 hypothetical protein E1292_22695 [Nonomuraea deserti]